MHGRKNTVFALIELRMAFAVIGILRVLSHGTFGGYFRLIDGAERAEPEAVLPGR